uniref:Uncharacterized protein n=1 Tax=Kwoniella pini CBS 10737 TaxID=1296096 RepID=A0A1B9I6I0_9TREE|nr:uncharacterized protein I206_03202 [Kwoniella pini CBS 10737]OCF51136.1 hypothetical protein I206_03202 [Kwoniella pini CBS 10737]
MSNKEDVPHPDRPFSPSPPRENRHSASRPPSLLFGAPPVGTVASSSTFSLAGLPSTPPARTEMNDSESSTTSSASPPLGATSILSELANPTPPRGHITPAHSPQVYHGRTRTASEVTSLRTPTLDVPASPKSYQSGFSSSSSTYDQLASSHSLPRLHQPTVVRRTSGRGLAFLPPPAHTVTHSTIVSHHPRSPSSGNTTISHTNHKTASVSRLQDIQHHASLLELGQPLLESTKSRKDERLIAMRGSEEQSMVQPTTLSDIPAPYPPDMTHEVGGNTDTPESESLLNSPEAEYPNAAAAETSDEDPDDHLAANLPTAAIIEEHVPATTPVPDHEAVEDAQSDEACALEPLSNSAEARVSDVAATEEVNHVVEEYPAEDTAGIPPTVCLNQEMPIKAHDPEHEVSENSDAHCSIRSVSPDLHEVATPDVAAQYLNDDLAPPIAKKVMTLPPTHTMTQTTTPLMSAKLQSNDETASKFGQTPKVPYKPRKGSHTFGVKHSPASDDTRQISFYATLNNPANPLPQFTSYRLELALLWGEAHVLRWIPGRKYIPDWNLKVVGGHSKDPVIIDVRVVIKTVVAKLPIFWRFASWL